MKRCGEVLEFSAEKYSIFRSLIVRNNLKYIRNYVISELKLLRSVGYNLYS